MISFLSKEEVYEEKDFVGIDKLLLSVLVLAINDYQKAARKGMGENSRLCIKNQAAEWIFSSDMRSPFAFLRICERFNFDPEIVRNQAKKLKTEKVMCKKNNKKIFK